jgi:hypothetical protein
VELIERARAGEAEDIDFLMGLLENNLSFLLSKLVDSALGQVESTEGQARIRHYLFNGGNQIQRNYAALYFKRRGIGQILDEAVEHGCIDGTQAYAR